MCLLFWKPFFEAIYNLANILSFLMSAEKRWGSCSSDRGCREPSLRRGRGALGGVLAIGEMPSRARRTPFAAVFVGQFSVVAPSPWREVPLRWDRTARLATGERLHQLAPRENWGNELGKLRVKTTFREPIAR